MHGIDDGVRRLQLCQTAGSELHQSSHDRIVFPQRLQVKSKRVYQLAYLSLVSPAHPLCDAVSVRQ
jgi:hypothetical protein